ncbi:MAG: hypothetical protein H7X80_01860 [bacterium]|nr:hypothetical protein [Candidatus Kapabacteria bacterium]
MMVVPASVSLAAIDPELEKQEAEVERLLKVAEAEFVSLKNRIDRDRNDRASRLAQAKADYEKATVAAPDGATKTSKDAVAASKADRALEKYQTELERALNGVDAARVALDRIESRVSQYRTTLEALRRRNRNTQQNPDSMKPSAMPDSSSSRTPITAASIRGVQPIA